MATLAVHADYEWVGGSIGFSIFKAILPCELACGAMPSKHCVYFGVLQATRFDHALCTAAAFLIGLEEQLHIAMQLVLHAV